MNNVAISTEVSQFNGGFMTPEQIALVQTSFKSVAPIASKAADLFYDRLFEIAPEVRPMFPADLSGQKVKPIAMLGTAVNNLHQPDRWLRPATSVPGQSRRFWRAPLTSGLSR